MKTVKLEVTITKKKRGSFRVKVDDGNRETVAYVGKRNVFRFVNGLMMKAMKAERMIDNEQGTKETKDADVRRPEGTDEGPIQERAFGRRS